MARIYFLRFYLKSCWRCLEQFCLRTLSSSFFFVTITTLVFFVFKSMQHFRISLTILSIGFCSISSLLLSEMCNRRSDCYSPSANFYSSNISNISQKPAVKVEEIWWHNAVLSDDFFDLLFVFFYLFQDHWCLLWLSDHNTFFWWVLDLCPLIVHRQEYAWVRCAGLHQGLSCNR